VIIVVGGDYGYFESRGDVEAHAGEHYYSDGRTPRAHHGGRKKGQKDPGRRRTRKGRGDTGGGTREKPLRGGGGTREKRASGRTGGTGTGTTMPATGSRIGIGGGGSPGGTDPSSSEAGGGRSSGPYTGRHRRKIKRPIGDIRGVVDILLKHFKTKEKSKQHIRVPVSQQPVVIVPQAVGGIGGKEQQKEKDKETARIIIKQTVKQTVGGKRKRKLRAKTAKQNTMKSIRKEYNTLRKQLVTLFRKTKQKHYKAQVVGLKGRGNKTERDQIKTSLVKRLKGLLAQMPTSAKKTYEQLESLVTKLKTLKW